MSPDAIWRDDLFSRRYEAELLISYIESLAERPFKREDRQAYTIAVEAPYGVGKTFFLKRLAQHAGLNHPVAFVDAWSDDLADEPLTALAATLEEALEPFAKQKEVKEGLQDFWVTASKVTKLVSKGLLKRGAAVVLTKEVVEGLGDVLDGVSSDAKEAVHRQIGDVTKGSTDDFVGGLGSKTVMEQRVADFREGKKAVTALKASLAAVVQALDMVSDKSAPIVIVIDELDRCRPTYALKLLEEIKHLFDVPGLVFILGINAEQLAHSVGGAYGYGFKGRQYLSRFVDREYQLAKADVLPLVTLLCSQCGLKDDSFQWPSVIESQVREIPSNLPFIISEYMKLYEVGARDAFKIVDILQTCKAVVKNDTLHIPYLLPLIIDYISGDRKDGILRPTGSTKFVYFVPTDRTRQSGQEIEFFDFAEKVHDSLQVDYGLLMEAAGSAPWGSPVRIVAESARRTDMSAISNYRELIPLVARLSSPRVG
jgi:hypothetical protein